MKPSLEEVCRAICIADGVDPDRESILHTKNYPEVGPPGTKYKLWEVRQKQAKAVMELYEE